MPGPWRPEVAPYLSDPSEAVADPAVDTVTFVAGAQMGKTEFALNVLGWCVGDRPRPAIYVGPTEKQVRSISRDRFDKMLRSTPALMDALDPRSTHQSVYERWLNGARLGFAWAGSATELASHPAALVLVDERDRMSADVAGEGDPVELARARTKNFHGSTVVIVSTPTMAGASPIWSWWEGGTRERWYLRCSQCEEWFYPRAELLRWDKGSQGDELRESARLACDACGVLHDDEGRGELEGRYWPTAPADEGPDQRLDIRPARAHRSFHVSGLASPFLTLGEIADVLAEAYRSRDQGRIQTIVNTYLGEVYEVDGDAPPWTTVWGLRAAYDHPAEIRLITAGCDVQQNRLVYVVRGWGWNAESWLLEHGELWGDTAHDDVWLALQRIIERRHGDMPIRLSLIDSGYNAAQVYQVARRSPNILPAKGHDRLDKPFKDSLVDERPSGRAVKSGVRLWHFDSDYFKSWLYGRIRWPAGEAGAWHVSQDVSEDYCKQVVNEQLVIMSTGRRVWRTTGSRQNHYLDAEVLAAVAAHILNVLALPRERPDPRPTAPQTPASTLRGTPSPLSRRGL